MNSPKHSDFIDMVCTLGDGPISTFADSIISDEQHEKDMQTLLNAPYDLPLNNEEIAALDREMIREQQNHKPQRKPTQHETKSSRIKSN